MPQNTNMLYTVIAVLAVVAAVLGYQLYEAKKDPKGVQINIGPGGVSMEKK
jgi:RsiW-degrading membrane proteinase PrsW (M82 family)